ncbi:MULTISPECIES: energy transducer TonB [Tenacibaculum]|uniref:energy transducer TonB n=1 Tax=Tenacibaculum TaxID=104267 RepID=UPI001F0B40E3|nr:MULTISPECIES: energy transducer TonB [Tenacibaculum]MCH3881081.1 energy transducer TonB [Tenacibaculum aquimarinum]MDO6599319.1 energy transducer TonB [Tenacibaculum sp. 1_MG-2023]
MSNLKKKPRKQLEKFSTVFMQLGLVLTLFTVYAVLEFETVEKKNLVEDYDPGENTYVINETPPMAFIKDIPKPKFHEPVKPKTTTILSVINKTNDETVSKVINLPSEDKTQPIDFNKVPVIKEEEHIDDNDDPKSFVFLEEVPIYRGCEGLPKEENKKCFVRKISKHVQKHFNSGLGQDLGLSSGKKKMYALFVIDKIGNVTQVKIKAPHKRLEKEVQRIVDKIPQFTPGKQQGKPVKVKYTLPITFHVE